MLGLVQSLQSSGVPVQVPVHPWHEGPPHADPHSEQLA
jgi:hypothetical protein